MWGIHQAAAPAKVGSRLSRELGSQGLLIPTAGAPRGGAQPVRGGRGHVGGLLSSSPHCPPSPTPNLQRNSSRVASQRPALGIAEGQGPARHLQSHRRPLRDQNPAICERKALLYFRLILSLGKAFPLKFKQHWVSCILSGNHTSLQPSPRPSQGVLILQCALKQKFISSDSPGIPGEKADFRPHLLNIISRGRTQKYTFYQGGCLGDSDAHLYELFTASKQIP